MNPDPKRAPLRIPVLGLAFFLLGAGVSALWFSSHPPLPIPGQAGPASEGAVPAEVPSPPPVDPAAVEAIHRSIPNLKATSREEATRILREAALAEFRQTAGELQDRRKKAEERFLQGQARRSDDQQGSANRELQELQTEQTEKLQEIAARYKAEIDALDQLKEAAR